MSDKVTVQFEKEHLEIITKAMEVYMRMKLGQFDIALSEAFNCKSNQYDEIDKANKLLRSIFYPELEGGSYGIGSAAADDADIASEIRQTFRQYLSLDKSGGYYDFLNVAFDNPLKFSNTALPKIIDNKFDKGKVFYLNNPEISVMLDNNDWEAAWDAIDDEMNDRFPEIETRGPSSLHNDPDSGQLFIKFLTPSKRQNNEF